MSDFDLRAIVRDVLDEGGCDTFRDYAVKVIGRIPAKEFKNVLMATLPDYVRDMDHRSKPVMLPARGEHASRRVQNIANAWATFIARHITTELGTQIRLADANEQQVRFYVGLLRVKAAQTASTADGFEQIADLMAKEGAGHVKDLPAHLATDLVKRVAA